MTHFFRKSPAFTIVELLIVIVVIAILAAISIVAYNGIQQRTKNSARLNDATQYEKILLSYHATYGNYPLSTGTYCLGEGFPDVNNDGVGDCWDLHTGGNRYSVDSALNTELKKIVSTLPLSVKDPVAGNGGTSSRMGPAVNLSGPHITYWTEGLADCPKGTSVWSDTRSRACRIFLPT